MENSPPVLRAKSPGKATNVLAAATSLLAGRRGGEHFETKLVFSGRRISDRCGKLHCVAGVEDGEAGEETRCSGEPQSSLWVSGQYG